MDQKTLDALKAHAAWTAGRGGRPADFTGAELRRLDFAKRPLREAKFVRADC